MNMDINKLKSRPALLLLLFFLHWTISSSLSWGKNIELCLMDPSGREDSVDHDSSFQGAPSFTSSPSSTPARRLSAAGRAAKLKDKNLIPPLHTPSDRRISLPRATKSTPTGQSKKPSEPASDSSDMPGAAKTPSPDASILDDIKNMIRGVRSDIASSEDRIAKRFDELSVNLSTRMDKTEADIADLSVQVSRTKVEIENARKRVEDQELKLPQMIEQIVSQKLESRPRSSLPRRGQTPRPVRPSASVERPGTGRTEQLEAKYLEARRSLRIWPVPGDDLMASVATFLVDKLRWELDQVCLDDCKARRIASTPDAAAKHQVVVTFPSIAVRDEIKSLARNLRGSDRTVGLQLEPPDHLRGQYQSFQKLAFQLKKKHPALKRNVKFLDEEMCLSMDVCLSPTSGWKTVEYVDAKSILSKTRVRTESFSLEELENLVEVPRKRRRETLRDTDDSDDNDETIIDLTDAENVSNNNEKKSYCPSLSLINTNSRSLGAKLESLADCFEEKGLDFASITETWFQDGRTIGEIAADLEDNHDLIMITRNRNRRALNGRQYGGVALVYRKKNSSFKDFPLHNPLGHEVLACIGRVYGNKGRVAVITCYAPPNLTSPQAQSLVDYLSDVTGEIKRKFPEVTIVISGDFNQWSIAELIADHPDLTEVDYGPTRGDRAIDRTLVNFGRSVVESNTLPPLETEEGRASDHRIAFARAVFPREEKKLITYSYREFTEEGSDRFVEAVNRQDWSPVYDQPDSSLKVKAFQAILDKHLEQHFKLKTTTRRESNPPWINDNVRRLWRKCRKVYDREGRSKLWKKLKNRSDRLIRRRAEKYMQRQRTILTAPDASVPSLKM